MEKINLADILSSCTLLAKGADKIILDIYSEDIEINIKEDNSPVTKADIAANNFIVTALKKKYPWAAILSEETVDDKTRLENDYCFIVDPLDGTKGFIAKNGEFTVNIALAYKQEVILGVVTLPVTGEIYYAAKGVGAFYEKDGVKMSIGVSDKTSDLSMVRSKNHPDPKEDVLIENYDITNVVNSSSSIKGCLVAHGKADIYYRFGPTSEWDTAAMQCIVEQAGGIFKQSDGTKMLYNREDTRNRIGFFAINRKENEWV